MFRHRGKWRQGILRLMARMDIPQPTRHDEAGGSHIEGWPRPNPDLVLVTNQKRAVGRINRRIPSIKSAARGFRIFEHYRIRILFFCGTLGLTPARHSNNKNLGRTDPKHDF